MKIDIRWKQRFENYCAAVATLERCVLTAKKTKGKLSEIIELGLIQAFEIVYELAWNCIKDYCEAQGTANINGSRDAIYHGIKNKLISNHKIWEEMIGSRIKTTHTYNEQLARDIAKKIITAYHPAFLKLEKTFNTHRAMHAKKIRSKTKND